MVMLGTLPLPSQYSVRAGIYFVHGAGDNSPTLREGHHWIFNIHKLLRDDGTPSLTSIRGTAHTMMYPPACETPGRQFIAWPRFECPCLGCHTHTHTTI